MSNVYREDMEITLQYFDGCPNWTIAAERLGMIAAERPGVNVNRHLIETPEDAETIGFRGSPSILVDGRDLFPDLSAAVGLACRIYATPAGFAGAPTLQQLREAIAEA
ncbi:MAG TPA: thioredoxin family protein [Cryobacterium sp.]|nr:thioredoxin family protein [Cryobacterium sp.]